MALNEEERWQLREDVRILEHDAEGFYLELQASLKNYTLLIEQLNQSKLIIDEKNKLIEEYNSKLSNMESSSNSVIPSHSIMKKTFKTFSSALNKSKGRVNRLSLKSLTDNIRIIKPNNNFKIKSEELEQKEKELINKDNVINDLNEKMIFYESDKLNR